MSLQTIFDEFMTLDEMALAKAIKKRTKAIIDCREFGVGKTRGKIRKWLKLRRDKTALLVVVPNYELALELAFEFSGKVLFGRYQFNEGKNNVLRALANGTALCSTFNVCPYSDLLCTIGDKGDTRIVCAKCEKETRENCSFLEQTSNLMDCDLLFIVPQMLHTKLIKRWIKKKKKLEKTAELMIDDANITNVMVEQVYIKYSDFLKSLAVYRACLSDERLEQYGLKDAKFFMRYFDSGKGRVYDELTITRFDQLIHQIAKLIQDGEFSFTGLSSIPYNYVPYNLLRYANWLARRKATVTKYNKNGKESYMFLIKRSNRFWFDFSQVFVNSATLTTWEIDYLKQVFKDIKFLEANWQLPNNVKIYQITNAEYPTSGLLYEGTRNRVFNAAIEELIFFQAIEQATGDKTLVYLPQKVKGDFIQRIEEAIDKNPKLKNPLDILDSVHHYYDSYTKGINKFWDINYMLLVGIQNVNEAAYQKAKALIGEGNFCLELRDFQKLEAKHQILQILGRAIRPWSEVKGEKTAIINNNVNLKPEINTIKVTLSELRQKIKAKLIQKARLETKKELLRLRRQPKGVKLPLKDTVDGKVEQYFVSDEIDKITANIRKKLDLSRLKIEEEHDGEKGRPWHLLSFDRSEENKNRQIMYKTFYDELLEKEFPEKDNDFG